MHVLRLCLSLASHITSLTRHNVVIDRQVRSSKTTPFNSRQSSMYGYTGRRIALATDRPKRSVSDVVYHSTEYGVV